MKRLLSLSVGLALASFSLWPARAETETAINESRCAKSAAFLVLTDSSGQLQYAPDREVQMLHLALDVTPDFKHRTIAATAALRFKPLAQPVREVKLNAVDLVVRSVNSSAKLQAWQATDANIILTFAEPVPVGNEVTVTIAYSAEPSQGLYFRTPEMGYGEGDTHLFSQGEAITARHWYPCLDSPNQRLSSEITCRVPEGMTVISNGRLLSQEKDPATGLVAFHWSQEKPHANYLVSLVAGNFKKLDGNCHGIPLAFYTPPSEFDTAANSFRDTSDMVAFFEKETGVPYPWDKYDQVCVKDFVAGGMENTSATTLTDDTLFTKDTENIRSSIGLLAHELAHQWFGDFVTCKDWSHIWLNEGFATYYESLYGEHIHGHDSMLYELYSRATMITGLTNDFTPIVRRDYHDPDEMFGYLVYPKASWVLHMLRAQLGPDLYRRCVKTYLERHQLGNVVTEDFRSVIEELSGRSFDQFFDQWLYHGHFPELKIDYSWDQSTRLAKVSIQQTQETNAKVLLFRFPLTLRFRVQGDSLERVIEVSRKQEDFYFPLPAAPELVRVDPEYTLLAKINFAPPRSMLLAQLADQNDMVGRLLALEQLSPKGDREAVTNIQRVLNQDAFYGVRLEAARALRSIHSEEALAALLASTAQTDARVRREVVQALGGFYSEKAAEAARQTLAHEKNPDILAAALRGLAGYPGPGVQEALTRALESHSFRNELAVAAIDALRSQDDPAAVPAILAVLSKREADFTSRGFAQGLDAIAYLDRNEEKKNAVREFLVHRVSHKNKRIQLASIRALDTLADPRALPVLRKFATAAKDSPERVAAEHAVADLRSARKPVDDFKNLRQEVLDLEKSNRDLRKDFDDLKSKFDAARAGTNIAGSTVTGAAEKTKASAASAP